LTPDGFPADTSRIARLQWIDSLRSTWLAAVRPFDEDLEYAFRLAPTLEPKHVQHCRVLPSREFMVRECLRKNAVVAEVGTYRGRFAHVIVSGAQPRELHLIDRDLGFLEREPLEDAIAAGRVRLHEGDSAVALASFSDSYFDWIYIDADHTYTGVKRDIEQAKVKLKPDGLLLFNDYIFWSHAELMQYGVVHAVNELCMNDGWELRYFALDAQMYCDVAVARIGAPAAPASGV
jgi:hypothetical protein